MARRFLVPLLVLVAAGASWPAALPAAQDDPRLDVLFEQLHATSSRQEAQLLQGRIWAIWAETRDDKARALMLGGTLAMRSGDLAGAAGIFSQLVDAAPDFAEAWNRRATVYYMMRRFDESIADCMVVLELEPRHYGALSGLGLIHEARGDPAEALHWFREAIRQNPHMDNIRARIEELAREVEGEAI